MALPGLESSGATSSTKRPFPWLLVGLGVAAGLLLLVGLALVGELGPFLLAGVPVIGYAGLAIVASLGLTRQWAKVLALIGVVVMNSLVLFMSAILVLGAVVPLNGRLDPATDLSAIGAVGRYVLLGLPLFVISLLPLLAPVRRWLARLVPIDPTAVTHTIALCAALALVLLPPATVIVLGGLPPLLQIVSRMPAEATAVRPLDQIYSFVWLVPASLVLVGYPMRRSFRATLQRLSLVKPSPPQILIGLAAAVGLVLAVVALDSGITWLWQILHWPPTDTSAVKRLLGGLINPIGAVIIGITAGLGEEIAVRGVLQPRLGIVLANLAFTAAHAYQYGFDGLLSVFLVGIILGLIRQRTNTSTAAITHGTYDFLLVMATLLGIG